MITGPALDFLLDEARRQRADLLARIERARETEARALSDPDAPNPLESVDTLRDELVKCERALAWLEDMKRDQRSEDVQLQEHLLADASNEFDELLQHLEKLVQDHQTELHLPSGRTFVENAHPDPAAAIGLAAGITLAVASQKVVDAADKASTILEMLEMLPDSAKNAIADAFLNVSPYAKDMQTSVELFAKEHEALADEIDAKYDEKEKKQEEQIERSRKQLLQDHAHRPPDEQAKLLQEHEAAAERAREALERQRAAELQRRQQELEMQQRQTLAIQQPPQVRF